MSNNYSGQITALSFDEIDAVEGGLILAILGGIAAVVSIAAGIVYIAGEYHDATCTEHAKK